MNDQRQRRETFAVLVEVPAGDGMPELRRALKALWRGYRLRCIGIERCEEGGESEPRADDERDGGQR